MSIDTQNTVVYLVVFATTLKLVYPVLQVIFQKLFIKKNKPEQERYSCYTAVCSKCSMK